MVPLLEREGYQDLCLFPGVTLATLCWGFGTQESLISSRLVLPCLVECCSGTDSPFSLLEEFFRLLEKGIMNARVFLGIGIWVIFDVLCQDFFEICSRQGILNHYL